MFHIQDAIMSTGTTHKSSERDLDLDLEIYNTCRQITKLKTDEQSSSKKLQLLALKNEKKVTAKIHNK